MLHTLVGFSKIHLEFEDGKSHKKGSLKLSMGQYVRIQKNQFQRKLYLKNWSGLNHPPKKVIVTK